MEALEWHPGRKRRHGRPQNTWLQVAEQDLKKFGINNRNKRMKDKKLWKEM